MIEELLVKRVSSSTASSLVARPEIEGDVALSVAGRILTVSRDLPSSWPTLPAGRYDRLAALREAAARRRQAMPRFDDEPEDIDRMDREAEALWALQAGPSVSAED